MVVDWWWLQWHGGWLVAGKREKMNEEEKINCLSKKKEKINWTFTKMSLMLKLE
jgi:hypothetical protein